jgi:hypothetical protein
MKRLTALVHGESGVGKSWLGDTCPGPRLLIDVEGRAEYSRSRKIYWNPRAEPLPSAFPDGSPIDTDTTVVVTVRDYPTFLQVYSWLASGQHYFRSVIIDSLSELQQRCMDDIRGTELARTQDWGELLRKMDHTVREYKDLRTHPVTPVDVLLVISGTQMKDGLFRPLLQGSISNRLAYHFDLVGFLQTAYDHQTNEMHRTMAIQPIGAFVAKDNTDILSQRYGVQIPSPNIEQILNVLNEGE